MDIQQQRLAEAYRLNAVDDLKAHIKKLELRILSTPSGQGSIGIQRDDLNKAKRILKHTEANKRALALRAYSSMDTSPREAIPESFDEWLALTRED